MSYNEVNNYAISVGAIFKLTSAKDGKGINVILYLFSSCFQQWLRDWTN